MSLHDCLSRLQGQILYVELQTMSIPPRPVVCGFRFQHVHSTLWEVIMSLKDGQESPPRNRFRILEVPDQKVAHGAILGIATHHAGPLETPLPMVWMHKPSSGCWYIEGPAAEMKAMFTPNNSETMAGWRSLLATKMRLVLSDKPSLVIQSFWPQALGGGMIHQTQVGHGPEVESPWESPV